MYHANALAIGVSALALTLATVGTVRAQEAQTSANQRRTTAQAAQTSRNTQNAQNTGAAQQLTPASAPGEIELDAISITATRQPTQVLEVPGTVTVTTRQQLDEHMVRDNQELVRYQPGVTVDRQTAAPDPWGNVGGFTIRGVGGNRVQIQVDGNRIQERITDGNRNFTDFPALKAVEIVRGPGSVLWGADALGGIVAFRTLDPDDLLKGKGRPLAGRVEATFDSFDNSFSKTAMAAVQLTPQWQAIAVINNRTYNEGKLRNARADGGIWGCPRVASAIRCNELNPLDANVWNMLGKIVYRPSADHELKLTGDFFKSDSTATQLYDFGRQTNGSFNAEYPRNQVQTRQTLAFEHNWNVGSPYLDNVRWKVAYSPQSRNLNSQRYQTNTLRQNIATNDILDYTEEFLQADVQLSSHFDLAGVRHNLTYGFQGDTTDTDYFRQSTVQNLTRNTTTVTRAGGFNFANSTTSRADLYIQDEMRMFDDRLIITPGVRWANYNIDPRPDSDYAIVKGREPKQLESSRLVPQIGAIFKLTDVYSLYARYAEGFKMPTAQQLYSSLPSITSTIIPNPNLKPEKVRSYEGGFRGNFGNAWFSIGAFHADYTDFIQSFYEIAPNTYTYRNLSSVKIWGIEAFGEYRVNENWALNAAASYQYGKQQYEAGDRYVPYDGASPLNGTVGVKWMKQEWGLEAEVMATMSKGVSRASAQNLYMPGAYAVLDAFLNWKVNETFTVRAGVLNIFDTRYFKGPLYTQYALNPTDAVRIQNPIELQTAPGRTFKLSAVANF